MRSDIVACAFAISYRREVRTSQTLFKVTRVWVQKFLFGWPFDFSDLRGRCRELLPIIDGSRYDMTTSLIPWYSMKCVD